MKALLKKLLTLYFRLVLWPIRIPASKLQVSSFEAILKAQEETARKLGFIPRHQFVPTSSISSESIHSRTEIGILIQGPIRTRIELEQLQKTIETYSGIFPESQIVLSTWRSSHLPKESFLNYHDVQIVISEDPGPSWPTNLLRQIVSTKNGLNVFSENDKLLVLKSRTDQRITNPLAFHYLTAIFENIDDGDQRLWVTDYGTGRNRLYGITDQMQFGKLSILKNYWAVNSVEELHSCIRRQRASVPVTLSRHSVAVHEMLLVVKYLDKLGHRVIWTWNDYVEVLRKYFGIIDSKTIGLELMSRNRTVVDHVLPGMSAEKVEIEQHLSFVDWLLLYSGNTFLNPSIHIQTLALKVPESDLPSINRVWGNQSPM